MVDRTSSGAQSIACPSSNGQVGTHEVTGIDIDSDGGTPDFLILFLGYYDQNATGNEITSVRYGDGTNWQTMTRQSQTLAGYQNEQVSEIYTLENPNTAYDRFEIVHNEALTEGSTISWAAYENVDAANVQYYTNANQTTGSLSNTFTGGATPDRIFVGANMWDGSSTTFSLNVQSQTVIATQTGTACNDRFYGVADKDWSSGATAQANGDYLCVGFAHLPDAGGGTTVGLSGTINLGLTPTATLAGTAGLDGAVNLALTPTADLVGAAALDGAVNLALTPTADLAAISSLAGSIALLLDPSGTLAGRAGLDGAINLALTPNGSLVGVAALAGSSDLALALSGSLSAGTAVLAGTINLATALDGTLAGTSALSGAINLALALDGNLVGTAALDGSANLVITPTGDLTATLPGGLEGTVNLALTPSADLRGTASLLGDIGLALALTGDLSGGTILLTDIGGGGFKGHGSIILPRREQSDSSSKDRDQAALLLVIVAAIDQFYDA